jgi:hypothetical protein
MSEFIRNLGIAGVKVQLNDLGYNGAIRKCCPVADTSN